MKKEYRRFCANDASPSLAPSQSADVGGVSGVSSTVFPFIAIDQRFSSLFREFPELDSSYLQF